MDNSIKTVDKPVDNSLFSPFSQITKSEKFRLLTIIKSEKFRLLSALFCSSSTYCYCLIFKSLIKCFKQQQSFKSFNSQNRKNSDFHVKYIFDQGKDLPALRFALLKKQAPTETDHPVFCFVRFVCLPRQTKDVYGSAAKIEPLVITPHIKKPPAKYSVLPFLCGSRSLPFLIYSQMYKFYVGKSFDNTRYRKLENRFAKLRITGSYRKLLGFLRKPRSKTFQTAAPTPLFAFSFFSFVRAGRTSGENLASTRAACVAPSTPILFNLKGLTT